jgi:hypothetical protein
MDQTNMLKGYADNYLNSNSRYNRDMYNDYRQQAMDYAGTQGNQGMRMAAAGANPFANEQYRGQMAAGLDQANNAYRVGMRDNQQLGASFMSMANQYKMHQEQLDWQKKQFAMQKKAALTNSLLGMGGTLLGAAMGGPIGGALAGGLTSLFKKPAAQMSPMGDYNNMQGYWA